MLLLLYALGVLALTVIPHPHPDRIWEPPWPSMIQWMPLAVDPVSGVLNVVLFVPFGLLVPLLWGWARSAARLAALAFGTSLAIELTQLLFLITVNSRRTVDVNDLIANTGGALLGLWLLRYATRRVAAESASH
jgi:glycopeptide antibiotics resistance protein